MEKEKATIKKVQIQPHEISTGVSLAEAQERAKKVFDTVVKPQVERYEKMKAEGKEIKLTPAQKAITDCHSPY